MQSGASVSRLAKDFSTSRQTIMRIRAGAAENQHQNS
ncbi:hypothetical protein [Pseudomonas avellanae]|nr:hypothetical protein [Pseudomonas avellanae]UQW77138.1 hypothetical protein L2Y01_27710 [Pseudomonas avellanae]